MFGNAESAEDFWKQSACSYKFFCISSTVIFIASMFFTELFVFLIDTPNLTIFSFQLWRLFVSFYGQIPNIMSILSLFFTFLWMRPILKDSESTIYKIIEVVLINLEVHIVFNVVALIFGSFLENGLIVGFGWFPIILIYEFRNSSFNPEAERNLCCLPFMIKAKYFPWILLALFGLLSGQLLCFVACGIVGYFQEIVWREMFLKLPFGFYSKLESCLPNSIKNRHDFISISQAEASLKRKCWNSAQGSYFSRNESHREYNRNYNDPYSQQAPLNPNFSSNAGSGYAIGGEENNNFRSYWANKEENEDERKRRNNKEDNSQIQTYI